LCSKIRSRKVQESTGQHMEATTPTAGFAFAFPAAAFLHNKNRISTTTHATYFLTMFIFFPDALLTFLFDEATNTDVARDFICDTVLNDQCQDFVPADTNCTTKVEALPTSDQPGSYYDGNSHGCRIIHAVRVLLASILALGLSYIHH